jgi:hypothetical protein
MTMEANPLHIYSELAGRTGGKNWREEKWREEKWREELAGRKMAGRKMAGKNGGMNL